MSIQSNKRTESHIDSNEVIKIFDEEQDQDLENVPYFKPKEEIVSGKIDVAIEYLRETKQLIEQNTIDSLLRYFQTGTVGEIHLPSAAIAYSKEVQRLLAEKMDPIITNLGFKWDLHSLNRGGEMILEFISDGITLQFASVDPFQRAIVFHFDFNEMEREREIKSFKVKHKIKETMEQYKDTRDYLKEQTGIKKIKNKRTIDRLETNVLRIKDEIEKLEKEIQDIETQKKLLETIKGKVPDIEYHLKKYGFSFEYVQGEQYEV